ncbi:MAG TPA: alpha/beta fold hydrolase [Pseudolabrys sp.]|nr:alpha/beta fold hydrolase [Pseudolabrys sp.]
MKPPETRYAKSGDIRIAYQIVGNGPLDLVFVPGFISNLDAHWEDPGFSHLMTRLGSFTRLIMLDKRGMGLSDRVDTQHLPSLETRMDDVRAVMDAVGSGRAALLGASEGGPMSILFAATYPERTRALILYGAYAHFHTWVMGREALEEFIRGIESAWGTGANAPRFAPEQSKDGRFPAWWGRYERNSASPNAAIALARMNAAIDVRSVLATIRVPTLVIHRREDSRIKFAGGQYLAEKIAGARFVEFPGRDHPIWTGEIDPIIDEIEEFLTGARPSPVGDRVLATVLAAKLVSPIRQAAQLGDRAWQERTDKLRDSAAQAFARYNGHLAMVSGEDMIGYFDGPARAVRCALALRDAAHAFGLELAAGVHTGEIEIRDQEFAGLTVHVAKDISTKARATEVLVSGVVADLVAGSGLNFAERGSQTLDGMPGELRLLAVTDAQHPELITPSARPAGVEALSAREREVLVLVADGLSNAAIAKRLNLSNHTIKRHVANILLKLDLPTRAAAAALVGRTTPRRGP